MHTSYQVMLLHSLFVLFRSVTTVAILIRSCVSRSTRLRPTSSPLTTTYPHVVGQEKMASRLVRGSSVLTCTGLRVAGSWLAGSSRRIAVLHAGLSFLGIPLAACFCCALMISRCMLRRNFSSVANVFLDDVVGIGYIYCMFFRFATLF